MKPCTKCGKDWRRYGPPPTSEVITFISDKGACTKVTRVPGMQAHLLVGLNHPTLMMRYAMAYEWTYLSWRSAVTTGGGDCVYCRSLGRSGWEGMMCHLQGYADGAHAAGGYTFPHSIAEAEEWASQRSGGA